ncbi:MAG: SIMPL domain-containing protein [Oscillospiraceae bacterium]|nr:SIMPL domain-containing protein [Oscillospiraceae bacterium]
MKKKTTAAVCIALALVMILTLTGCGASMAISAPTAETPPEITVSASASVKLVPDKATVSFGVTTQETTADEAQTKNSEAVHRVMDVLTGRGIEEKSIRTDSYSMYPQYDWSQNGDQKIIGYVVTTSMSVQDQDIEEVGKLIAACVEAGANDINSVLFFCSGYDEAYRQALAQAVSDSRAEAEVMAKAAGRELGDPVTIVEGWQDASARYGKNVDVPAANEAADSSAPIFQPGETEITANVTATYRMK